MSGPGEIICDFTLSAQFKVLTNMVTYFMFVNDNPKYPLCQNCKYDVYMNHTFHVTNDPGKFISNDFKFGALDFSTTDLSAVDVAKNLMVPYQLHLTGHLGFWSIVLQSSDPKLQEKSISLENVTMHVNDSLGITWCKQFTSFTIDGVQDIITPDVVRAQCTNTNETETLQISNGRLLITFSGAKLSSTDLFGKLSVLFTSSTMQRDCEVIFRYENLYKKQAPVDCTTLPIMLYVDIVDITSTDLSSTSFNVSLQIDRLFPQFDMQSLKLIYYTNDNQNVVCKTFNKFNYSVQQFGEQTRINVTKYTTYLKKKEVAELKWNPDLENVKDTGVVFLGIYENPNSDKLFCSWKKQKNESVLTPILNKCPTWTVSWPSTGGITVTMNYIFSPAVYVLVCVTQTYSTAAEFNIVNTIPTTVQPTTPSGVSTINPVQTSLQTTETLPTAITTLDITTGIPKNSTVLNTALSTSINSPASMEILPDINNTSKTQPITITTHSTTDAVVSEHITDSHSTLSTSTTDHTSATVSDIQSSGTMSEKYVTHSPGIHTSPTSNFHNNSDSTTLDQTMTAQTEKTQFQTGTEGDTGNMKTVSITPIYKETSTNSDIPFNVSIFHLATEAPESKPISTGTSGHTLPIETSTITGQLETTYNFTTNAQSEGVDKEMTSITSSIAHDLTNGKGPSASTGKNVITLVYIFKAQIFPKVIIGNIFSTYAILSSSMTIFDARTH
ncbi:unknown [Suid gammaherpesvirus 3]|uniref:Uncharacterized protein n=1 Tax=Suid gammaherpesvirus 3 TaxID=1960249 RepID=Q8JJP6_9GAMA|nr:unknown [Porcine lymphotropic herpesvirus 1]AAM22152.1 unknown [Porcine lymphotropic herpesvirus 1]